MKSETWIKSPELLVFQNTIDNKLALIHRLTNKTHYLDPYDAQIWITWDSQRQKENVWRKAKKNWLRMVFY